MSSSDDDFLRFYGVTSQTLVKLFARVKDRIKPGLCSHNITSTTLDITLVKENDQSLSWIKLEPDEYSKPRTYQPVSTPAATIIDTSSNIINPNRGKIESRYE